MTREERIAAGIARHAAAVADETGAAAEAYRLLHEAYEEDPADWCTAAYCGSAAALMAREARRPQLAFGYGLESAELLDAAVDAAPDDVTVRFLRAMVNAHLPEAYFHRTELAVSDLEWLLERCRRDPQALAPAARATVAELLQRCRLAG